MIKRILSAVGVCGLIALIWVGLRYLLVDDTSSYTRIMMYEFYNQETIDVVFCGASLCYRSFDTEILDSELGANTFNMGSSSQTIDVTYYLLKDCLDRYNVNHVYLELSPIMASYYKNDPNYSSDMTNVYIISDYMKTSLTKIQLLLQASEPDQYGNSFLVARRNWKKIYDTEYIRTLLQKKAANTYMDYEYITYETEWYKGKGYVESSIIVEEGAFNDIYPTYNIDPENINESWYDYVQDIIELCEKRDVELTFVCTPLSIYLLECYGEKYDKYHDRIANIADLAGVNFWDFNLVKKEYFPTDENNYMDSAHLNMYGAQLFSKLFSRIINDEVSYNDICYQSIAEKLAYEKPRVLGLESDGENKRIITTNDNAFEYNISVTTSDGNKYIVQDFCSNTLFSVNEGESGTIHIKVLDLSGKEKIYDYCY